MTNEEKLEEIVKVICEHTVPKEQLGFFTEQDLAKLIWNILCAKGNFADIADVPVTQTPSQVDIVTKLVAGINSQKSREGMRLITSVTLCNFGVLGLLTPNDLVSGLNTPTPKTDSREEVFEELQKDAHDHSLASESQKDMKFWLDVKIWLTEAKSYLQSKEIK